MPGALPHCDNRCPQILQNASWGQNPSWLGATGAGQSDKCLPPATRAQVDGEPVLLIPPEASRHSSVMPLSRGIEGFAGSGNGGRQGERPVGQGDAQTEVQERGRLGWAHCTKELFFAGRRR